MSIFDDLFGAGDPGGGSAPGFNDFTQLLGGYDPRLDPGIPSIGNDYGGGGDVYGNNPNNFYVPAVGGGSSGGIPGGGTSSGAGGSTLGSLLSSVGGIGGLAGLLGPLLGGLYQMNNVGRASDQLQQASKDANNLVSGIYGQSKNLYEPFVQGGQQAFAKAGTLGYKPLAGNFAPLSGLTLGNMSGRR